MAKEAQAVRTRSTLLVLASCIVAAAVYFLFVLPLSDEKAKQEDFQKRLFAGDVKESVNIYLETPNATMGLVLDDGVWTINNAFAADSGAVEHLLEVIEKARIDKSLGSSGDLAQFSLDMPGIVLRLTYIDGNEETLNIGGANPSGTGFYATSDAREEVFLLDPEVTRELNLNSVDLRDNNIFAYDPNGIGRIVLKDGADIIDLMVSDGRWVMRSPYQYEAAQDAVSVLLSTLRLERAVDYVAWRDEFNSIMPWMTMELYDEGHILLNEFRIIFWGSDFDKQVLVHKKGSMEAARVRRELWNTLRADASMYLERRTFRLAHEDVRSVTFSWGGKSYALLRMGDMWLANDREVETQKARDMLRYVLGLEGRIMVQPDRYAGKPVFSIQMVDTSGSKHTLDVYNFDLLSLVSETPLSYVSPKDGQRVSVKFLYSRASDLEMAPLIASSNIEQLQVQAEGIFGVK